MNLLALYGEQIRFARSRTNFLLSSIPQELWFWMPTPSVSHVAWQVGHLAMAQYRMVIERVRGGRPEDSTIISPEFIKLFSRTTVPQSESSYYPPTTEIREVDNVHNWVIEEIQKLDPRILSEPPLADHAHCKDRAEILRWCSHHEMIHSGQI